MLFVCHNTKQIHSNYTQVNIFMREFQQRCVVPLININVTIRYLCHLDPPDQV